MVELEARHSWDLLDTTHLSHFPQLGVSHKRYNAVRGQGK